MKKRTVKMAVILGAAAVIAVGAAGCGRAGGKDIGKDAALEAALGDAGVSESDTTRLKVSQERDDGRTIYEIRFDADGKEYDYEVAASDGQILSVDVEMLTGGQQGNTGSAAGGNSSGTAGTGAADAQTGTAADTQNGSASAGQQSGNGGTAAGNNGAAGNAGGSYAGAANVAVSMDEAAAIALERVPGATRQDLWIELDYDDGVYKYEGDIIYDQKEYDFEIDANTGTILEWSEERV